MGQEDPLEKEMVTHSSIIACEIPWTEEPGGLESKGSQRVGHSLKKKQQQPFSIIIVTDNTYGFSLSKLPTAESPLDCKEIQTVHPKRDQS